MLSQRSEATGPLWTCSQSGAGRTGLEQEVQEEVNTEAEGSIADCLFLKVQQRDRVVNFPQIAVRHREG